MRDAGQVSSAGPTRGTGTPEGEDDTLPPGMSIPFTSNSGSKGTAVGGERPPLPYAQRHARAHAHARTGVRLTPPGLSPPRSAPVLLATPSRPEPPAQGPAPVPRGPKGDSKDNDYPSALGTLPVTELVSRAAALRRRRAMPPTGKPVPSARRRWGSHRRPARVGDGGQGAMTRVTSPRSWAS